MKISPCASGFIVYNNMVNVRCKIGGMHDCVPFDNSNPERKIYS